MPEITETLYVTSADKWRKWLEKNHSKKKEIWLIYYKKSSGKKRIPYDNAVEEAICFGWIDSIVKRIDDEKYCQRFTPRKTKSIWSELNLKRAKKMIKEKKITKTGLEKLGTAFEKPITRKINSEIPKDLEEALNKNKKAKEHFKKLSPSHKRHYIWFIEDSKRQETRERRIMKTIKDAENNKKPGT